MLAGAVALNSLDNVYCHQLAVSDSVGQRLQTPAVDYDYLANFGALGVEPGTGAGFDGKFIPGATESMDTTTIDALALAHARLLKIDTEGMELKVLAGAAQTLERCRPVVFVEFTEQTEAQVRSLMQAARFHLYRVQGQNFLCVPGEFPNVQISGLERVPA
jgi:FkbM family methyltransferase